MRRCTRCYEDKPLERFAQDTRYVGDKTKRVPICKDCNRSRVAEWRKRRREVALASAAKWRAENRMHIRARDTEYRKRRPDLEAARKARFRKLRADRVAASNAERQARKLCATPLWANRFFIDEAYALARLRTEVMGYKWHVDHIVPLRSKLVCGLHVENNLRVIPAVQNYRKNNLTWLDMPAAEVNGRL